LQNSKKNHLDWLDRNEFFSAANVVLPEVSGPFLASECAHTFRGHLNLNQLQVFRLFLDPKQGWLESAMFQQCYDKKCRSQPMSEDEFWITIAIWILRQLKNGNRSGMLKTGELEMLEMQCSTLMTEGRYQTRKDLLFWTKQPSIDR
jgi:hypothetical protein